MTPPVRIINLVLASTSLWLGQGVLRADDAIDPVEKPSLESAPASESQHLVNQFKSQRDAVLSDRRVALQEMRKATNDAERRKVIDDIQARSEALHQEQKAQAKRIRDELRKIRDAKKALGT